MDSPPPPCRHGQTNHSHHSFFEIPPGRNHSNAPADPATWSVSSLDELALLPFLLALSCSGLVRIASVSLNALYRFGASLLCSFACTHTLLDPIPLIHPSILRLDRLDVSGSSVSSGYELLPPPGYPQLSCVTRHQRELELISKIRMPRTMSSDSVTLHSMTYDQMDPEVRAQIISTYHSNYTE